MRHTWSLSIEEQFYFIWPAVAGLTLRGRCLRPLGRVAALGSLASIVYLWVLYDGADPTRSYFDSFAHIHEILLGVCLAIALESNLRDTVLAGARRLWIPAAACIAICIATMHDDGTSYYRGGTVLVSLATVALLASLETSQSGARWFSWRPLVLIGTVSYGIYFWHWPIFRVVELQIGPTSELDNALVALVVTAVATVVSYRFVESPVRQNRSPIRPARTIAIAMALNAGLGAAIVVAVPTGNDPAWARQASQPQLLAEGSARDDSDGSAVVVGLVGDSVTVSL